MTKFEIYVNGRLKDTCFTWSEAERVKRKYESLGYKVEIK